jgi:DNA-directed RNA polymerase III subunit RPC6
MLANVTPSVELTGGPWYSDGGLDQAFIDGLLGVCLNYVKKLVSTRLPLTTHSADASQTFPRKPPKSVDISDEIYVPNPVYPPSHTKRLPSPAKVLEFIVSSGISQQTLAVEHVMQLMNVLVYNGEVEILKPPSGTRHEEGWNSDLEGDGGGMADKEWKDEVARRKSREKEREKAKGSKKRARGTQSDSDTGKSGKSKGRSKSKASSKSKTDSDSGSDSDKGSASDASSSGGGGSARRASLSATSGSDSGTDSDDEKARAKKRRKKEKERELKEREKRRAKEKEKRRRKKEKERKAREREREREKKRKRKEKERKEKKRKAKEKEKVSLRPVTV